MRAAVLEEPGKPVTIRQDVEIAAPKAGQVSVEVRHCGLCHSDLSIIDGVFPGMMPLVLGHEAAGVVPSGSNPVVIELALVQTLASPRTHQ